MRVPIAQPANIKILKPKHSAKVAPVENTKTNLAKLNVKDAQTGITKKKQLKTQTPHLKTDPEREHWEN